MTMEEQKRWVQAWGQAHAPLSLMRFKNTPTTFRLVFESLISGESLRVRLSNRYGRGDVKIGASTAALCDADGNIPPDAPVVPLLFAGAGGCTLSAGSQCVTDAATLSVRAGDRLCVSLFVAEGVPESGNALTDARLLFAAYDCTKQRRFVHEERFKTCLVNAAPKLLRLRQPLPIPLFEAVELDNREEARSIVCFGDSLTEQGWWTDAFRERIKTNFPGRYTLVNKAITGNRLLHDASPVFILLPGLYGERGITRVERDVLAFENISHVLLFLGTNDVLQPGTEGAPPWERVTARELADGLRSFSARLQDKGIHVIGMGLTPCGGCTQSTRKKDSLRRQVNALLREEAFFDTFVDLEPLFADPKDPYYTKRELVGGDKAHFNAAGGRTAAEAIPLSVF